MAKNDEQQEDTERVVVRPHPADPLGVRADVITSRKPVHVDWGDSSKRDKVKRPGRKPVQHSYGEPGSYRITALDDDGEAIAHQQVVVRATIDLQGIDVDADDGIRIAFTDTVDDGTGVLPYYRIEWPDGDIECVWGVPGRAVRHDVLPGKHDVRIVDTTTGRVSWFDVHVEDEAPSDPDFTVTASREDNTGMTIVLRLTAVKDHPVHIWWDDADGPQVVERPQPEMEIPHRYVHPGHYLQTVAYSGELSFATTKAEAMTVPTTRENRSNDASAEGTQPAGTRPGGHDGAPGGVGGDSARASASGVSAVGDLAGDAPVGQFPPQPTDQDDTDVRVDMESDGTHPASGADAGGHDASSASSVDDGDAEGEVAPVPVVDRDESADAATQETTG